MGIQRGAEINHSEHKRIESAEDIDVDLSIESRIKLFDAAHALDGAVLCQMSQWLADQKESPFPSNDRDDMHNSRWFTAQYMRDHSAKSYFVEGCDILYNGFVLPRDIDEDTCKQIDDITEYLGEIYYSLDDTDSDYVSDVGKGYMPKKHVTEVYLL